MPTKRALIVDDSRSARHILGRMLESFGLEVDAVEAAELALTYLQTTRPDVIFMDHLMPGMDGFAAVRVIKANPDTATIPVLMYTSQEGEMYLSQARALGAMGVLPKTLKHADVAEALQHLGLHTPVIAAARPVTMEHEVVHREPAPRAAPVEVLPSPTEESVPDLVSALSMSPAAAPQWAHRIATEVHAELQRHGGTAQLNESIQSWRVTSAVMSVLVLLLLALVIYQQVQIQQQLQQLQSAAREAPAAALSVPDSPLVEAATAPMPEMASPAASSEAASRTIAPPPVEIEGVPYGEVPLSGERLDHLRAIIDKLRASHVKGLVRVEVFLGDFCLTGNSASGYMPAEDEVLVSKCDLVGNPFGDALTVQQRQSVAFANLVSSTNSNAATGIKVQLVDGAHRPVVPYPAPAPTLTAGAWNRIAERNQRVEYMVLPAS